MVIIIGNIADILDTSYGKRFAVGIDSVLSGESFMQLQFESVMKRYREWLPFGLGPGLGSRVDYLGAYEIHNGLLAILVEMGILGFIAFGLLLVDAGKKIFSAVDLKGQIRFSQIIAFSFLIASVSRMVHGTLFRDRGFLLFLGIAAGFAKWRELPAKTRLIQIKKDFENSNRNKNAEGV